MKHIIGEGGGHLLTPRMGTVSLIDVTRPCEDAYSKLVKVVAVADVSGEDRVGLLMARRVAGPLDFFDQNFNISALFGCTRRLKK